MEPKWKLLCAIFLIVILGALCSCGSQTGNNVVDDFVDDLNAQSEFANGQTFEENLQDILGITEDEHVTGVKGGTNSAYPGITYEEAFENFFSNPTWRYFVGTQDGPDNDGDGEPDYTVENVDVVEFTGGCIYADVEVTALIQFVLDEEAGTFQPTYLSLNEIPQNMLMLSGLMETVFTQAVENGAENETVQNVDDSNQIPDTSTPDTESTIDFPGSWLDATGTYQVDISTAEGTYTIEASQKSSDSEWRQWSLEGYIEREMIGNGIFYSGVYVDLYLRDDGTVGGGVAPSDAAGVIFLTEDGILHWVSDTGELESAILLTKN